MMAPSVPETLAHRHVGSAGKGDMETGEGDAEQDWLAKVQALLRARASLIVTAGFVVFILADVLILGDWAVSSLIRGVSTSPTGGSSSSMGPVGLAVTAVASFLGVVAVAWLLHEARKGGGLQLRDLLSTQGAVEGAQAAAKGVSEAGTKLRGWLESLPPPRKAAVLCAGAALLAAAAGGTAYALGAPLIKPAAADGGGGQGGDAAAEAGGAEVQELSHLAHQKALDGPRAYTVVGMRDAEEEGAMQSYQRNHGWGQNNKARYPHASEELRAHLEWEPKSFLHPKKPCVWCGRKRPSQQKIGGAPKKKGPPPGTKAFHAKKEQAVHKTLTKKHLVPASLAQKEGSSKFMRGWTRDAKSSLSSHRAALKSFHTNAAASHPKAQRKTDGHLVAGAKKSEHKAHFQKSWQGGGKAIAGKTGAHSPGYKHPKGAPAHKLRG